MKDFLGIIFVVCSIIAMFYLVIKIPNMFFHRDHLGYYSRRQKIKFKFWQEDEDQ